MARSTACRPLKRPFTSSLAHYNEHCTPFVWTATADAILDNLRQGQPLCERTSGTRHLGQARTLSEASGQTEHVYTEARYAAGTWAHERRAVIKAEVVRLPGREPRDNPRFVITNLRHTPRVLSDRVNCAPLQTSDALGAAAVPLGPQAIALAVRLNKQFGVSFGKIAALFRSRFALRVTPSALVRARHRAAAQSAPTSTALCETVRTSPVVIPDETGWKVRGPLHGLWVFATATTTVYCIRRGRGFADAASVLGVDFAGGLGRDGWAPYRPFADAFHQTYLGHLLGGAASCRAIIRAPGSREACADSAARTRRA